MRSGPPGKATSSYHKRPLPPGCIAFSSEEGRAVFREALALGTMESFFPLIEQFHTQAEPAFCGLGTLVMVLNALEIDPGRAWKGPWRWFSEEQLDCCRSLDDVARDGITLTQFACLARCNGARADVSFAETSSLEALRAAVREATSRADDDHVVVAYDRRTLDQTGSGHFSPVGGMHPDRDLALLLDVARFKYPPHWVPLEALHRAMLPVDPTSGRSRGFVTIRREHAVAPVAALHEANWAEVERFLRDLDGTDVLVLTGCLREGVSSMPHLLELLRRPDLPQTLKQHLARLRAQVAALDARPPPL
ncbi:phytochelatin synthase family protein [Sorangium sp. So ce1128]